VEYSGLEFGLFWRCFVREKGKDGGGNRSLIQPSSVLMGSASMRGFSHRIYHFNSLHKSLIQ